MIAFIRHGKTQGNLEGRYVGTTDEPLCEAGIREVKSLRYPNVERVFASPMRRCVETAGLIYPNVIPETVPDFREIDFGDFEYKTYAELSGDARYQTWVDSNGTLPFPGGECREAFCARCVEAFEAIRPSLLEADCALIVHGGTIMAILERYADCAKPYFEYQVKNAHGYVGRWTGDKLDLTAL